MKNMKNILILFSATLSIIITGFITLYYMFPISIIDDKTYNTNKLNRLSKQRKAAYNELLISLQDELYKTIEMICKAENEQNNTDIQSILGIFYSKSTDIDNAYFQLLLKCNTNISFPLQRRKTFLLNEIFPAYINIIKYNGKLYNEFALKLLIEKHEYIANKIIEAKTNDIIKYIDFYSSNSAVELLAMTDFIGYKYYYETNIENFINYYLTQCIIKDNMTDSNIFSNVILLDDPFLNIPLIGIDGMVFSLAGINELKKSMEIASAYLIKNTKDILIDGINYQTEVYKRNIEQYADWYYSYLTGLNRKKTNIIGLFKGEKSAEERFYLDNFNRIMNNNANFDYIIKDKWDQQTKIIFNIYNEYSKLKNYFSANIGQITQDIISENDFMEPYINNFVTYFDQVFGTLDTANIYYIQEYTIDNDVTVKNDRTSTKKESDGDFVADFIVDSIKWIWNDYLSLKTQETLNRPDLVRKISDSMMKNQSNKIVIINDPFNYLIDKLRTGSIIFVGNYFVGYPTYQHYGVYIGNGNVIHFAPFEGQEISFKNGIIHETTLEKFCSGRALRVDTNIKNIFTDDEIIERARSRLNEKGYDLFSNNCEHFARWCATNEHISYQIKNLPEKVDDAISVLEEKINMGIKFVELIKHIKEKL